MGAECAPLRRVDREARRPDFDRARRRVVLGDGAPWIWRIADEQFPDAVQIVEVYHAHELLFESSGPSTDTAANSPSPRRGNARRAARAFDDLLGAIGAHAGNWQAARKGRDFFANNRSMCYPEFFRVWGTVHRPGVARSTDP